MFRVVERAWISWMSAASPAWIRLPKNTLVICRCPHLLMSSMGNTKLKLQTGLTNQNNLCYISLLPLNRISAHYKFWTLKCLESLLMLVLLHCQGSGLWWSPTAQPYWSSAGTLTHPTASSAGTFQIPRWTFPCLRRHRAVDPREVWRRQPSQGKWLPGGLVWGRRVLGLTSSVLLLQNEFRTNNCGLNHLRKVILILELYLFHCF